MKINDAKNAQKAVGIDIGTTTISAIVYDLDDKRQIESYTLPHNSYTCTDVFSEQDACTIIDKAQTLLYHILDCYQNVVSIGLSGQMHGIVYIDSNGNPCSNLMNWQDKRADQILERGKTACEEIEMITGQHISTGYGMATHYYNIRNKLVPKSAVGFCSIMDLLGMKICGLKKAITHASVASSFGLYDLEHSEFMKDKLLLLGIDKSFLPSVTSDSKIIGECKKIPVCVAIGDNQASFLGSVSHNDESILINVGTGSQVSSVSDYRETSDAVELRPYIEGKYLICGSALCGGFAYSMLESFFRSYVVSAGMQNCSQYNLLNQLATDAYERGEYGLLVDTSFLGKRNDPSYRGSITQIDRQSFTPSSLALGVLKGMCRELYELYQAFEEKKTHIVASGGAIKNNDLLRKLMSDQFGMSVSVGKGNEEASRGVALLSAFAVGKIPYKNGFGEYID